MLKKGAAPMYKAKVSFCGVVSMRAGDVKDIPDVNIAEDLLKAGYIEEVKPAEKAKQTAKPARAKKSTTTKRG